MNVRDLIAALKDMDPEAEVHFTYNYGDHWRTQVAPAVDNVEEGVVTHSAYHSMDKVVDEDDVDDKDEKQRPVVLIS